MSSLGFIILRHVNSKVSNEFWIECYSCVRKFYPNNKIMIIDDDSNYEFITEIVMENTIIINSEYKGRGELLPYIYYLRNPIFEKAVFIHDSVFFQKHVNFDFDNVPLWYFDRADILIENREKELQLISTIDDNNNLLNLYNSKSFVGCFGGMSIMNLNFLKKINDKYNLEKLIDHVSSRHDRMCLERILGLIFAFDKVTNESCTIFGNISNYNYGYSYNTYLFDKNNQYMPMIPVIKVWSGR